jgi:hypothetical protein
MSKRDEILNDEARRTIWLNHIRNNRKDLENAIDMYHEAWYNIRSQLAECGAELTPDELKELTEFIEETFLILDEEEND